MKDAVDVVFDIIKIFLVVSIAFILIAFILIRAMISFFKDSEYL